ncbi:hypothetical protein [Rhizorhabdus sp.]|uniref:hypothetical protein n=1 Tax=Rhizorhabdus sp. TaxID=1968843 RepID=UPI0035B0DFC0
MSSLARLMSSVGPVAEAFVWDRRIITMIMGPVGSAKTTTCIRKLIHIALWQNPGPDGVRRARIGVIRDTYPLLKKTVLQSWWSWFGKEMGEWNGESPFTHKIMIFVPGKGHVEIEVIFAAIGESRAEDVMRGWELTALWLNEADLLAKSVFSFGLGRIGRFPNALQGGCAWSGIIMDFNAPDIENWTYTLGVDQDLGLDKEVEEELREEYGERFGVGFHRQPGGRSKNPPPENIQNLPRGYYAQQMIGQTPDYIRRMIDNEFGPVRNGLPVYPEFKDGRHVQHFQLIPSLPLFIGCDQGLLGAAVIGQLTSMGQLFIWDELTRVVEDDHDNLVVSQIGAEAFGREVANHLTITVPNYTIGDVWCDPAGAAGEQAIQHRSWRQNFQKGLGIPVHKATVPGNAIEPRLSSVRKRLIGTVDGEPSIIIHPRCKVLRKGFNSAYVFRRTQIGVGGGRYEDKPLKNQYSDVHDALQYLCFMLGKGAQLAAESDPAHPGRPRMGRRQREPRLESDYDKVGDA